MTTTIHNTCAHEACRCSKPYSAQTFAAGTRRIEPDDTYCSERCEVQAGQPLGERGSGGCECAHPECTPQTTVDIPPI